MANKKKKKKIETGRDWNILTHIIVFGGVHRVEENKKRKQKELRKQKHKGRNDEN